MPYVAEDTECLLYSNVIASTHINGCCIAKMYLLSGTVTFVVIANFLRALVFSTYRVYVNNTVIVAWRSYSATGLDRPLGLQEFKAPRFQDNRHMSGKVVSPTHRPLLPPRGNPDSTLGPYCGRKD